MLLNFHSQVDHTPLCGKINKIQRSQLEKKKKKKCCIALAFCRDQDLCRNLVHISHPIGKQSALQPYSSKGQCSPFFPVLPKVRLHLAPFFAAAGKPIGSWTDYVVRNLHNSHKAPQSCFFKPTCSEVWYRER